MPAPLWEDAKTWLLQQGVDLNRPDAHVVLNDVMNKMAEGLVTRPSYGGNYGAPIGSGSIQQSELASPISSPTPVTKGSDEGYALPKSSAPGPVARNAPARDARQVRAEAGQVPVPVRKPMVPGNEPDIPGGAPPGAGQAQAATGSAPQLPGSGSEQGLIGQVLDWFSQNGAKVATGLGLAGGVGLGAMGLRSGASAGMRPRSATGLGIGEGLPVTPPGGGDGSGFGGAMGTPIPMPPGPGANPMTGTLPLGAPSGGALVPSATMPMPPPPMPQTGVMPSGPAMSVPPDVINQGGPDIAGMLSAPQGPPSSGGRIRSPRPRTPPTPKSKPTTKTAKKKSSQ